MVLGERSIKYINNVPNFSFMKYKYVKDLTSDVMFEAYGKNLKELFANSALAMFEMICKIKKVKAEEKIRVEVEGDDLKELMHNWLQELIALVDTKEMFFSKFVIKKIDEKKLVAECYGEEIKPELGETVVKALTYYGFDVRKEKGKYVARVSLDI